MQVAFVRSEDGEVTAADLTIPIDRSRVLDKDYGEEIVHEIRLYCDAYSGYKFQSLCLSKVLDRLYSRVRLLGQRKVDIGGREHIFSPPSLASSMSRAMDTFCNEITSGSQTSRSLRSCRDGLRTSLGYDVNLAPPADRRVVLFWNPVYLERSWMGPSWQGDSIYQSCEYKACWNTIDRGELNRSAALWFYCANMPDEDDYPPDFFSPGPKKTIFACMESPIFVRARQAISPKYALFDWTMTPNTDSDISPAWYYSAGSQGGGIKALLNLGRAARSLELPTKSKRGSPVAWLVSNCKTPSRRENFVRELKKHMDVDVYGSGECVSECDDEEAGENGACSTTERKPSPAISLKDKCPNDSRQRPDDTCVESVVLQSYYFYLALENSACRDYVTEKFWRALRLSIVPVVLSGDWYDDLVPPGYNVFVRASDFSTTEELAVYLNNLASDEDRYREYFRWREVPFHELPESFRNNVAEAEMPWCSLCRKLHEPDSARSGLPTRNVSRWFGVNENCMPNQADCCWV
eukprot:g2882.t1